MSKLKKDWPTYLVITIIVFLVLMVGIGWLKTSDRTGLIVTVISSVTLNILLIWRILYIFNYGLPKEEELGPGAGVRNHSRDLY